MNGVRGFLSCLCDGQAVLTVPFHELRPIALGALARVPHEDGAEEDLVSELLLGLVAERKESLARLIALEDGGLRAAMFNRLRRLAVEHGPHWSTLKAIRQILRRRTKDLATRPEGRPAALDRDGRLSADLVCAAAAWVLAQDDPLPER